MCLNSFNDVLNCLIRKLEHIVITGDFNVHFEKETDWYRKHLYDLFTSFNFTVVVTERTKKAKTIGDILMNF